MPIPLAYWLILTPFWFPPSQTIWLRAIRILLTLLAWAGWFMLWRSRHPALIFITTIWLTFPVVYVIVYWSSRYRYPIEWTLLLCTAFMMSTLAGGCQPPRFGSAAGALIQGYQAGEQARRS